METSTKITIGVFAAIVVLLAAVVAVVAYVNTPKTVSTSLAHNVGQQMPDQGAGHIQAPTRAKYTDDPPTGGQHYNVGGLAPRPWGQVYGSDVIPEYWVHNLEHGGIAILYNCPGGCQSDVDAIKSFMNSEPVDPLGFNEIKLLAVQYPVPGHRFALVAWNYRMFLDSWDPAAADRFYQSHVDQAPEKIA